MSPRLKVLQAEVSLGCSPYTAAERDAAISLFSGSIIRLKKVSFSCAEALQDALAYLPRHGYASSFESFGVKYNLPEGDDNAYGDISVSLPDLVSALIDMKQLSSVVFHSSFEEPGLSSAALPQFTRLLHESASLSCLTLGCYQGDLFGDVAIFDAFCAALKHSASLRQLSLCGTSSGDILCESFLDAIEQHRALEELQLSNELAWQDYLDDETFELDDLLAAMAPTGALLARLVSANVPSLKALKLSSTALGDAGAVPFFHALTGNTHLEVLYCNAAFISAAVARDVVVPALLGHASLKCVCFEGDSGHLDYLGGFYDALACQVEGMRADENEKMALLRAAEQAVAARAVR